MITKRKIIFVIGLIIIFSFAQQISSRANIKELSKSTDLEQAYELALSSVKEENSNAILYFITSADEANNNDHEQGEDGRRRLWNIDFVVPGTEQHYIISIVDGKVAKCESVKNAIDPNRLNLNEKKLPNTSNIVRRVINKYNLKPGKAWAFGYHFSYTKQNNNSVLIITGADEKGNMAKVLIDASTGKILSFNHKVLVGGGIYKGEKSVPLPSDKLYSIFGIAKPNKNTNSELIIWGRLNSDLLNSEPVALISNNDGEQWTSLNLQENVIKLWYSYENTSIYAATDNGIFISTDLGKNWSCILEISNNSVQDVSVFNRNIAVIANEEIYLSEDEGKSWSKESSHKGATEIKACGNGVFLLENNELFKKIDLVWNKVDIPKSNEVYRLQYAEEGLIVYDSSKMYYLKDGENSWKSLEIPYGIEQIFVEKLYSDNNQIYVLCKDRNLYQLGGGDSIRWTGDKMFLPTNGDLAGLTLGANNTLYYSMIPILEWEIISEEN